MSETLPPATSTLRPLRRLRGRLAALAAMAFASAALSSGGGASAKGIPETRVLLGATVTDAASGSMAAPLWAKLVSDFIGGDVVVFPGGIPTTDDCTKAKADYVVVAPFDLRKRLPGIPYTSDRIPAQTHITVTNCLTGATLFDRTINIDSDPQSNQPEGDLESVPEISWSKSVPATLRKYSLTFPRVAHIVRLDPPFGYVDIAPGSVRVGQGLRVFARADRTRLAQPIILTVASVDGKYAEVQFSTLPGAQRPGVGDLVEPIDDAPTPTVSAAPSPQGSGR